MIPKFHPSHFSLPIQPPPSLRSRVMISTSGCPSIFQKRWFESPPWLVKRGRKRVCVRVCQNLLKNSFLSIPFCHDVVVIEPQINCGLRLFFLWRIWHVVARKKTMPYSTILFNLMLFLPDIFWSRSTMTKQETWQYCAFLSDLTKKKYLFCQLNWLLSFLSRTRDL